MAALPGGGGNAGVVASVDLVWASKDKEKVSVPLPCLLPGTSSLVPALAMSSSKGAWKCAFLMSGLGNWANLGTGVRAETRLNEGNLGHGVGRA